MKNLFSLIFLLSAVHSTAAFAQETPIQEQAHQTESDERQVHHDGIRNHSINKQMASDGRQISKDRQIEQQDLKNGNTAGAAAEKRQIAHDKLQVHDDSQRIKTDKQQAKDDERQADHDKTEIKSGN